MRKPRGFTIVELVVVMTIMAILLTLGVVGLNASQLNARNMKRDTDIDAIAKGLEVRYVRGNAYAVAPAYINKGSYPSVQEFRHAQGIAITGISPTQTSMYLDQILTGTKIDNFIPPGAGDGADEVFGGYRKHQAELRWRDPGAAEKAVALLAPFWRVLPRSRNSPMQDRVRQLDRFARMSSTDAGHRFLQLAAFIPPEEAQALVSGRSDSDQLKARDAQLMEAFQQMPGMNGVLLADVASTLPNDMLYKVDLTSMAHGLEVRTPFLDLRVVELAFSLSPEEKLRKGSGKHILRETFGDLVPASVMSRSKKGFEVPLLALLQGPLQPLVDDLLTSDLVTEAGLDKEQVAMAVRQLRSTNTGHSQATVHALIVYITWWKSLGN